MKIKAKQINEWVKKAYDNAVKHGWHEEEKSNAHWLMMVCTEVAEAVQADRKGNYMDDLDKEGLKTVLVNDHGGGLFNKYYSDTIEGKVESELADICIRVFDLMGVCNILAKNGFSTSNSEVKYAKQHSFTENAFIVTRTIVSCTLNPSIRVKAEMFYVLYESILSFVFEWAEALGINLVQHINLKMRYNETREYHHGGKKY
jgi:hypothetical protein